MSCQKGKRLKAIGEFQLAGVHYGTKEIIHVPGWELDIGFMGLLRRACDELYGPGWENRLKFEENKIHEDTDASPCDDKTDDSA